MFAFYDPSQDVRITTGNLPHWYQPGVTYFVTFRAADSVPTAVADRWHRERDDWLRRNGIRPDEPDWAARVRRLPAEQRREYSRTFPERFLEYLDLGAGECALRSPEAAELVARSLLHFDGHRYLVSDFVVMPNHVHVLVGRNGDTDVVRQCYSWKKYSAGELNRLRGRTDRFWQEESFDHAVRSPEQFQYFREYIARNPEKAGLRAGEYLLYRRAEERHTECAYYTEEPHR